MTGRVVLGNQQLAALSLTNSAEEIARRFGLDPEEVAEKLAKIGRAGGAVWVAKCNRTKRRATARTERGAYVKAQLMGFADYELFKETNQGEQP